jgi:pyrroline-5-carboxylate reductase
MACSSDVDPAKLRRRVTSPNGTTERAINTFQAEGFETLVENALTACRDRSIELADELCQD